MVIFPDFAQFTLLSKSWASLVNSAVKLQFDKNKFPTFERDFLIDQNTERMQVISGVDYHLTSVSRQRRKRAKPLVDDIKTRKL